MTVEQISVFLENKKGRLAELTQTLAEANVDLIALSIADTTNFGILRAIVSDTQLAIEILKKNGFTVNITEVLAAAVPDVPGGLAGVLGIMAGEDISVEYLYSFICRQQEGALILFRVEDPVKAAHILQQKGVKLVTREQLAALRQDSV